MLIAMLIAMPIAPGDSLTVSHCLPSPNAQAKAADRERWHDPMAHCPESAARLPVFQSSRSMAMQPALAGA